MFDKDYRHALFRQFTDHSKDDIYSFWINPRHRLIQQYHFSFSCQTTEQRDYFLLAVGQILDHHVCVLVYPYC